MGDSEKSLLEPADWDAFRKEAHRALDVALDFSRDRAERAVWTPLPEHARTVDEPLPRGGESLQEVVGEVERRVLPHTLGNTHPRFWGWVNGSGTPSGIVSQLLTGAINANLGGRDHSPIYIERQLIRWMCELFDFPLDAGGLICTGTSTATLYGLAVARHRALGAASRQQGNSQSPLVAYCSAQAHVSVSKAVELMGLGSDALRPVPVLDDFSIDCSALADQIAADVEAGLQPFAVISSVGSVNTGAIDDLQQVNAICEQYRCWHHVDGAFGALISLSETLRPRLAGIEKADSLAFDFHKWMHVTYSSACLLVRDREEHLATFATAHSYLRGEQRGVAGGAPWPNDFGIDLSRGFAALGPWMLLREMGSERLGLAIERNCEQAAWLGRTVDEHPQLELLAPVSLNIVCFRYVASGVSEEQLNRLNRHLVVELQCRGIAVPSFTELHGTTAIRVCIANHRTAEADLQALVDAVPLLGEELLRAGGEPDDFAVD
ncbi:cytochrome D ubiquinol oxidase subunit I [Halioglobus maricola]|uniref:Cytochrome D ubiquinol oxidase subunit I n=1 Tax=Halioglobus maricola TaxID=2601894 RepID=A0A5P9NIW3_9GAMM|nr:pyridoxal-dependent decarboxylase [Halioglobus maricola]QFU75466.1 cytochrome D ubiquinol oxidase subunit I [Halioglobus maricola]